MATPEEEGEGAVVMESGGEEAAGVVCKSDYNPAEEVDGGSFSCRCGAVHNKQERFNGDQLCRFMHVLVDPSTATAWTLIKDGKAPEGGEEVVDDPWDTLRDKFLDSSYQPTPGVRDYLPLDPRYPRSECLGSCLPVLDTSSCHSNSPARAFHGVCAQRMVWKLPGTILHTVNNKKN